MQVRELEKFLSRQDDDLKVLIRLALPSMGPIASCEVSSVYRGIDWDKDVILVTKDPLVTKNDKQSVFETAYDLLMWLATKPTKRDPYEVRRAKQILLRYGKSPEDFERFRHLFHEVDRGPVRKNESLPDR